MTLTPTSTALALALAVALAAPGAAPGQAAPRPDSTPAADTAYADTFALPAVVVTATRVPLDRRALPTPVSVLEGEALRARGVRSVAEALRQVPGAAVVRGGGSGGQTSLFLRGGESDYVKVLIDGVPVNDPGGAFDFASLSTDQVERIEVVRGPVSVLYGSDAVAGVVQVFTRRGSGQPRISAELTGGTGRQRYPEGERFTLYDAEASVAGAAGPVSYVAGGGREYSEGVYPLNNEHALHTGNLRLAWRPVGGAELALTSRLSDARSHFPTDGAGNIVDANAYLDRRLWSTAVQGGWQPAERIDVRFQLGLVARDQSSVDAPDGPADTTGVFASTLDFDGVRRLADARINARVLRGTFTAGVSREAAKATTAYTSESSYGPTEARGDYERGTTGYYVQLLSRPLEPLSLTLGGRLDDSDTYDTFETYRVGAALALAEGLRLRGALGRAFREPTFAEAFGSGFGDVGNPGLRPERSRSRELGADYEIGLATLAGTWFHQEFDQLIQYTFSPPAADDPNYFNVGAARSSGLELEARAVTGRWSGEASYSRVETEVLDPGLASDATFAEGEPLLRRPAHSGTLATRYTGATATLAVTVNAVGAREDVDFSAYPAARVELPAYATLDVAADYLLPLAVPTRLLLRIDNLFDADYRAMAGFPAPGRLVRLGARVRTR